MRRVVPPGPLAAIVLIAAMALAPPAGSQAPDPRATTRIIDFPDCCPRPDWWDEVEDAPRIGSLDEFNAVWRDDSLGDRQKAKALFRAIEEFTRRDDDITAAAVNYYYWVDQRYEHMRRLYEFGVGRFLDYDRPLENYSGKAGDMTAGMVNNLAKLYLRADMPERAVPWLRYTLETRGAEVNDHLLENAAAYLGDALNRLGQHREAIEVLLAAKRDYDGDWEKRLDEELSEVRAAMGPEYYLHDTRLSLPLAVGAAVLVLLLLVLRGRSDRSARRTN